MTDADGNELKVGDQVHYFGWHNMKPVGIIEGFTKEPGSNFDIAIVRPLLSKKPGSIQRFSSDVRLCKPSTT